MNFTHALYPELDTVIVGNSMLKKTIVRPSMSICWKEVGSGIVRVSSLLDAGITLVDANEDDFPLPDNTFDYDTISGMGY